MYINNYKINFLLRLLEKFTISSLFLTALYLKHNKFNIQFFL